jgi:peptidyl-tRNA hydrolase, PTH1 family
LQVGFDAIDKLARQHGLSWSKKLTHKALTAEGNICGTRVVLAKPMCFMNVSGESVSPLVKKHGFFPEQVRA